MLSEAERIYEQGHFDYIELYIVPRTLQKVEEYWNGLKVPMVIHAPHFRHGFNLADKDLIASNSEMLKDAICCADVLNAYTIIDNGWNGETKEEATRELKSLKDSRLLI
jgi:deoxyribonuclease IV